MEMDSIEQINRAHAISQLALEALQDEEFEPYEEETNSRVRKVSEILRVCSIISEHTASEGSLLQQKVGKVCHLADAVSSIADLLIGDELDEVLLELKSELPQDPDEPLGEITENAGDPDAFVPRPFAKATSLDSKELATTALYDHRNKSPFERRWHTMNRNLLINRIPNSAAIIFGTGVAVVIISLITTLLTGNIIAKFVLIFALVITSIGLNMGERALSDGQEY